MKKITLNEELTRIQEMMGVKHISPSGKETNMSPEDDDYEINYGKNAIKELSPSDIVNSMREEEMGENEEVKYIKIKATELGIINLGKYDGFKANKYEKTFSSQKSVPTPFFFQDSSRKSFGLEFDFDRNQLKMYAELNLMKANLVPLALFKFKSLEPGEVDDRGWFKIVGDSSDYTTFEKNEESAIGENDEVKDKFKDQYGNKAGEKVYYATANKQDRDPETFEKNEEFDPSDSDGEGLSDCCGAPIVMHDICSECGEHCEAEEEYVDEIPGFEGTRDALDDLGIREEVDEESAIGGWDLAMESIDELQKELEEEEGSWMAMRAGKDGPVYENEEMGEARKIQQETYFETQAGALESAEEYATNKGYTVNWGSINPEHVAYGQTVSYSVELMKDGMPARKMLQISLYRMESGRYELTNYVN